MELPFGAKILGVALFERPANFIIRRGFFFQSARACCPLWAALTHRRHVGLRGAIFRGYPSISVSSFEAPHLVHVYMTTLGIFISFVFRATNISELISYENTNKAC